MASQQLQPASYENPAAMVGPEGLATNPFPPVMNAYYTYSLAGLKSITLCGASEKDRIFCVETHTGYSGKPPLGTRPGILIHNGPSLKDPIHAAAGDESMAAARQYHFSLNSVVLLPPLDDVIDSGMENMVTEVMHAHTVPGDKDAVAFRFEIEVGNAASGKRRREEFEWRSVKKGDKDPDAERGGFKLFHLGSEGEATGGENSTSNNLIRAEKEDKVNAVLAWSKITAIKHAFSLQIKGPGLSGLFGERWTLMVVATALRIWVLHGTGRTTRTGIRMGEKLRNK